MVALGGGAEKVFIACIVGAPAQVHILKVGKEVLVKIADLVQNALAVERRTAAGREDALLPGVAACAAAIAGLAGKAHPGDIIAGIVGQLPVKVSDHQALHCKDFRVGLSGADQLFQPLGFGKGIVVEQHHIFTVRQRNALIHCMGKAGIGAVFDEGEIFAAAVAAGLLKAFVGGTVVHHNEPEVLFGLGIDRLDGILEPALAVDVRDHDGRFIHKDTPKSVHNYNASIAYLRTKRNRIPAGCGFGRAKIMRQGLFRCWKEWCRDPRRTPEPPHRWELR